MELKDNGSEADNAAVPNNTQPFGTPVVIQPNVAPNTFSQPALPAEPIPLSAPPSATNPTNAPPQPNTSMPQSASSPSVSSVTPHPRFDAALADVVSGSIPESSSTPSSVTPLGTPLGSPLAHSSAMKKSKKKLFISAALVSLLLLGGGAGAYFGIYVPNKPQNVWNTGLNRSGAALEQLVTKATAKDKLATLKKSELTATVDSKIQNTSYGGTLNVKFDTTKADGALDVTAKESGSPDKLLKVNFKGELPPTEQYPNAYVQVTGLNSFGIIGDSPALAVYEGKWIAIGASYFKTLGLTPDSVKQAQEKTITADDIAETAKATTQATSEYILTADPAKAVFERKNFVGKENPDGVAAYHYRVGINKAHAKDFCKAFTDKIAGTPVYKKLASKDDQANTASRDSFIKDCQDSADKDIKDSDTFDVWIDSKYKLIYKARVYDRDNKDTYTDIGQRYKGGDDIALFVKYHDPKNKTDFSFDLATNLKSNITKGTAVFTGTETDNAFSAKVTLEAKPYSGEINVQKPAGTIPIEEVLQKLGIDPAAFSGSSSGGSSAPTIQAKAEDIERQTDIKALHGQVEAYYAQKGTYPTFAELNSSAWRTANMKGLDNEALKDPKGTAYTLVAAPAAHTYSYAVTGSNGKACNNTTVDCAVYALTTILENGTPYTKNNLN